MVSEYTGHTDLWDHTISLCASDFIKKKKKFSLCDNLCKTKKSYYTPRPGS